MFGVHRAELIYSVSTGDRRLAILSAQLLVDECRIVQDVELACKGLRNAAEAFATYGEYAEAQAALHESRSLAVTLRYDLHVAKADLRLADLSIHGMDSASAFAYIDAARSTIDASGLQSPLLIADLSLFSCWASVVAGDLPAAAKAARQMSRCFRGPQQGNANYSLLAVKLATFRGKRSREIQRDFNVLRSSISTHVHYPLEQYSLAALLLADHEARLDDEIRTFVGDQFPRLMASGCSIWPFLHDILAAPHM